jgi:calcium/calmodulin-dependent protein kinase I
VKLIDFGLATILEPNFPETMACGSPGYLAPEIYKREGYDTKVDVFSLGVILYVT